MTESRKFELPQEIRVLRLLSHLSSGVPEKSIDVIRDLSQTTLKKMTKDGLISINEGMIEITESGRKRYEVEALKLNLY